MVYHRLKSSSYYDNIADQCIHECSYLTIDRTKLWQDIRITSTAAFEFLHSQNMFLVSNVLLGMANAQLNNILNDELDNFKRVSCIYVVVALSLLYLLLYICSYMF